MAMEDAVALSHCIENYGEDIEDALQRYQKMRKVRTARVQINSRLIGEYIYHPDDAKADVRNHIMQSLTPEQWYDRLNWLYGSNGLEG